MNWRQLAQNFDAFYFGFTKKKKRLRKKKVKQPVFSETGQEPYKTKQRYTKNYRSQERRVSTVLSI